MKTAGRRLGHGQGQAGGVGCLWKPTEQQSPRKRMNEITEHFEPSDEHNISRATQPLAATKSGLKREKAGWPQFPHLTCQLIDDRNDDINWGQPADWPYKVKNPETSYTHQAPWKWHSPSLTDWCWPFCVKKNRVPDPIEQIQRYPHI